ncbi:polymorphic toxin type 15 domain-containing protein [Pseudomonas putida]
MITDVRELNIVAGEWYDLDPSSLKTKTVNSAIGGSWIHKERASTI